MNKRGASLVIAWVLLLGLSISLAIGVFSWSKLKTEALTESSVTFVEGSLECNEVKISIKKIGECDSLDVYNRGKLSIEKLALSSLDGSSSEVMNANLVPLQNKVFDYSGPNVEEGIEVLPLVRIGDDLIACRNSRVLLDCLVLITIQTPFDGAPVSGTQEISAEVSEEEGVSVLTPSGMIVASAIDLITGEAVSEIEKVEFKIDGIIIGNPVTSAPYSIQWDTTKFSNGEHEITAVVTYKSGNKESSSPVKVTVDNAIVVSQPDPSPTTGTTYYVATTGSDATGTGSIVNPWKTIQYGYAHIASGDTLYIRGGTYDENIGIDPPSGTSESTRTIISAYPSETVIILPTTFKYDSVASVGGQYITFKNLIFDAGGYPAGTWNVPTGAFAFTVSSIYVTFDGSTFRNAILSGVQFSYTTQVPHHNLFLNSMSYNNGRTTGRGHGMYMGGHDNVIDGGEWYNNAGYGIQIYNSGSTTEDDNIVRNVRVYGNGAGPTTGGGIVLGSGHRNLAYNNLVYDNDGSGISPCCGGTLSTIANNIIDGNKGSGVEAQGGISTIKNNIISNNDAAVTLYYGNGGNIIQYNEFSGNSQGDVVIDNTGKVNTISNNLIATPLYVDLVAKNFRIQSGSPGIDKGVTLTEFNTDLDGKTRPIGSAWDIGAYEYGTITNPITTTSGVKAFPTAEGYAANTVGGRGGRVIHVTNLNDNGPGSFRDALLSTGPRIIVFDVSGTISLLSSLEMRGGNSYVTIAGQTSPGGIQLKNFGILMYEGTREVIIRHLRLRLGTYDAYPAGCGCGVALEVWRSEGSGYTGGPVYNIIVDHSDLYWSMNKNLGVAGSVTDITLQWSIIAEGTNTGHFYGTSHNDAMLIDAGGGTRINLHHNLLFDHEYRSPSNQRGITDFRNNYVYGWGSNNYAYVVNAYYSGQVSHINFVKNVYKRGPYSGDEENIMFVRQSTATCLPLGSTQTLTKVYYKQNMGPYSVAPEDWGTLPPKDECTGQPALSVTYESATPVMPEPVITETDPRVLWTTIKDTVGAYKPSRDALDTRIISETISGNSGALGPGADGLTFDWPTLTGGSAPIDSDKDGMPNSWETSHGLNQNDISDGAKVSSNGYTYVENYLNELAGDIVPAFT